MPNENFRRELGHVFDEMTGSPTAALPDRVRSSIANAPEQRGPFWVAGIAATLIAALLVGILIVAKFGAGPCSGIHRRAPDRHASGIRPADDRVQERATRKL